MASQRQSQPQFRLPRIVPFLAEAILKLNGCQTEGIFRVPGDADAITELKLRLEKGVYDLEGVRDASTPASLLKFWYDFFPRVCLLFILTLFCVC